MTAKSEHEAFVLLNEREKPAHEVVSSLNSLGVATYYWNRDIRVGEQWRETEQQELESAQSVLVFLGTIGWGPNQLPLTVRAKEMGKRLIPILVGDPSKEALAEAGGLFRDHRYLDLRKPTKRLLQQLVDEIRSTWQAKTAERPHSAQVDAIVATLIDGSDEQRLSILQQVQISKSIDRAALAERLRYEILEKHSPGSEKQFVPSVRDPKRTSSVRSWMLSALIWTDTGSEENRQVVLRHLQPNYEDDRIVRFWALAGLYSTKARYLAEAARLCSGDPDPAVSCLAMAVVAPRSADVIEKFRAQLRSNSAESAWSILRVLRVVPIVDLVSDVCMLVFDSGGGSPLAYDALYALARRDMAVEAARILSQRPGVDALVTVILISMRDSNPDSVRGFASLLSAFDAASVNRALRSVQAKLVDRERAELLLELLAQRRQGKSSELFISGYASDSIEIDKDLLDIQEDVRTLAMVMLAREVKPPLAIGLFGDWGSGKSYFMRAMRDVVREISKGQGGGKPSAFCSDVVQIEFNAWHYVDTNLWASLVSYILEKLADHVSPKPTSEERKAAFNSELGTAKEAVQEIQAEKQRTQEQMTARQTKLQEVQLERQKKEIRLSDLRAPDLAALLSNEEKQKLGDSLKAIGVPQALNSISGLSGVISEAYTAKGRITAIFLAALNSRDRKPLLVLLGLGLVGIPLLFYAFDRLVVSNGLITGAAAIVGEFVALATAAIQILRKGVETVNTQLTTIENIKRSADELLARKRQNPTAEEVALQKEIAGLESEEREMTTRLEAATAKVLKLEEQIQALQKEGGLANFLVERNKSEDYKRHLGLISTIRRDFESLGERLEKARGGKDPLLKPVDRIVLYIDDLDRCPEDKVVAVLEAVHLLLAFPLFVVVVGVDPRWLLHSLGTTYSAFKEDGTQGAGDPTRWRTTPQNYLEKIFQIPFNLRPMSVGGFEGLMKGLLSASFAGQGARPAQDNTQPGSSAGATPQGGVPVSATPQVGTPPSATSSGQILGEPQVVDGGKREEQPAFTVNEESLSIKPWEAKFAQRLFILIPTPRAAKRFTNIYRLLKAPVSRDSLSAFEGAAEIRGEFQVPMLLLAISIGAPVEAASIFPQLYSYVLDGKDPNAALRDLKLLGLNEPEHVSLGVTIAEVISDSDFVGTGETLQYWIPRVARFSFDLGRIVRPVGQAKTEPSV